MGGAVSSRLSRLLTRLRVVIKAVSQFEEQCACLFSQEGHRRLNERPLERENTRDSRLFVGNMKMITLK